MFVVLACVDDS